MTRALGFALLLASLPAVAAPPLPTHDELGKVAISPAKQVDRVDVWTTSFAPGAAVPRHMHTVPLVCVVTSGELEAQIGDAEPRRLAAGAVSLEPAGAIVGWFRNPSATASAAMTCMFLASATDAQMTVQMPAAAER